MIMSNSLNILELFSGIGGMNYALKKSEISGEIKGAIDINPVANNVYQHNHHDIKIFNSNIQNINPKFIRKLNIDTILMSPPCQPFTRVGKQKDVNDNRTDALKHICNILSELKCVQYILMENVKGFEKSEARLLYQQALSRSGFYSREFIISPSQLGVPNTRHRYFCLARKSNDFDFENKLWESMPKNNISQTFQLQEIIESDVENLSQRLLSDDILRKRIMLLDIVFKESTNSICFTKAYTHYCEGTGSVFCPLSENELKNILEQCKSLDNSSQEYLILMQKLKLRYFTPCEVSRLMCFPESFSFPQDTSDKQKYRLLGNSVNVLVVSELLKLLVR